LWFFVSPLQNSPQNVVFFSDFVKFTQKSIVAKCFWFLIVKLYFFPACVLCRAFYLFFLFRHRKHPSTFVGRRNKEEGPKNDVQKPNSDQSESGHTWSCVDSRRYCKQSKKCRFLSSNWKKCQFLIHFI
jgi:hypothetical protein